MTKSQTTKPQADILIVDDTPPNLRLLGQILGKHYKVRLAPSGQIALLAAFSAPPDLILLDVMMPELNGYEVADRLKADPQTREIPILFISALDDVDSKLRAFAAGGVDYVTKPFQEKEVLARVETHLTLRRLYKQAQEEIVERKQVEEKLRQSEERFRLMANSTEDVVFTLDCDQRHTGVFGSWVEKNGLTADSFLGKTARDIFGAEAAVDHEAANRRALQGEPVLYDWSVPGEDGLRHYQTSLSPLRDATGDLVGLVGIGRDVTERRRLDKALRESEMHYRALVEGIPGIVYSFSRKTGGVYYSLHVVEILGYSLEKLYAEPMLWHDSVHPDDLPRVEQAIQGSANGKAFHLEYRIRDAHGNWHWFDDRSIGFKNDHADVIIGGLALDITERKQVEDALRESEAFRKRVFDSSRIPIVVMDGENFQYVDCNASTAQIYEFSSREEVLGKTPLDVSAPVQYDGTPSAEKARFYIEKAITEGAVVFEWRHQRPSGEIWDGEVHLMSFQSGQRQFLQFTLQDITERKRVEKALRESQELFSLFMRYSPVYAYIKTVTPTESRVMMTSENYQELIGIPNSKMVGKTMEELFPSESAAKFTAEDWAVVSSGQVLKLDEDLNGRNYTTIKFPIVQGDKTLLAGYTIDITERKQAENALRASTAKLETLFQVSPLAISLLDPQGKIQLWNAAAEQIFGWKSQEVIGHPNPIVPMDKQTEYTAWSTQILHGKPITNQESVRQRKDGSLVDVSISSAPIYDAAGAIVGRMAILADITERKQSEDELRRINNLMNLIVENIPNMLFLKDARELRFVRFNRAGEDLLGYSRADLLGKNDYDFFPKEQADFFTAKDRDVLNGNEVVDILEEPLQTRHKGMRTLHTKKVTLRNANEEPEYLLGISEDITERKQAEENIHRMVERWSIVYRAGDEISASLDSEQVFVAIHRAIEKFMSCEDVVISLYDETRNEMGGNYLFENNKRLPASPYVADHGLGGYIVHSGQSVLLNSPEQIKASGIKFEPYGTGPITSSVLGVPLQIKGKAIGMLSAQSYRSDAYTIDDQELLEMLASHAAIAIDNARLFEQSQEEIAERKRIEEALRESEEKYHKIFNNEIDAICIFDIETKKILDVNNAYLKLYGYTRDEALQLTVDDISVEQENTNAAIQKARMIGDVVIPERKHRKKDGTVFLVELSAGAYTWKGRNVIFALARDITERKQAEESLLHRNQEMATLYETSLEINALSDVSALLLAIIRRACDLLKISSGSLYLVRPDEEALELVVAHQLPPHWVGKKVRIGDGLAGQVLKTKKPMAVEDYLNWEGRLEAFNDSPTRRALGVPLKIHDQIMGVIVLVDKQVGTFSEDEIRLVSLFADQAAIAVSNAQFAAQLEERVAQRTSELEAANHELENLSYNIAHDMRSPVRAMVGYSGILQQSHRAKLDSEGMQLLENIHTSGMRLGQMIDSFLTFLHLGHATIHVRPVDMNSLVRRLIAELGPEREKRQVEFSVGDLPECRADSRLLEQVWAQLISNALKFTRPRQVAQIEIGSGETDGQRYYFVRDNGVGFDMRYADKLFGVFQKLHHESDFEGLGIGLAIARRIVQSHGGKMRAEAEVNKGAAFYFTLAS